MGRSKKGGRNLRRKNALEHLKLTLEAFKAAGVGKKSWTTTRNGRKIQHRARSFAEECKRLTNEIAHLRELIARG